LNLNLMWCWSWLMTKSSTLMLAYFLLTNKETPVPKLVLWIPLSCIDHSPVTARVAHSHTLFYNFLLYSLSFSKLIRGGSQTMVSVAEMRRRFTVYTKHPYTQVCVKLRWVSGSENNVYLSPECRGPYTMEFTES